MQALLFNYAQMSVKVRNTLQKAFGPNAAIRTDEGEGGQVYVRIVSDRFDGMSDTMKQDSIWNTLRQEMEADAQAVALVLAFGTDQL